MLLVIIDNLLLPKDIIIFDINTVRHKNTLPNIIIPK